MISLHLQDLQTEQILPIRFAKPVWRHARPGGEHASRRLVVVLGISVCKPEVSESLARTMMLLRRNKGFTLIELLVVIAIIGILVGLLLPAVQQAREAARRTQCRNHLKQLGLAIHNYESVFNGIPPNGTNPVGARHGWNVRILPYLEQTPLANQYSSNGEWFDPVNQPVYRQQVPVFQCPSAPNPRVSTGATTNGQSWTDAACTDYSSSDGVDSSAVVGLGLSASLNRSGLFSNDKPVRFAECTDGLTNTILIVEDAGRPDFWVLGKKLGTIGVTSPTSINQSAYGVWAGRDNKTQIHGHAMDGLSFPGPCAVNCTNWRGLYAFHPQIAHACFGDGSVRGLSQNLNIYTLIDLTTRAGGEVATSGD